MSKHEIEADTQLPGNLMHDKAWPAHACLHMITMCSIALLMTAASQSISSFKSCAGEQAAGFPQGSSLIDHVHYG